MRGTSGCVHALMTSLGSWAKSTNQAQQLLLGRDAKESTQRSGDAEVCIAPIALSVQIAPRRSNSNTAHALIYARHRLLSLGAFVEGTTTS